MNYSKGSDNMNKKYGFTLIELLAVIVILAIIALIAVPIILKIIDSSKKSADKISIDMYGEAVQHAVAKYSLKYPSKDDITFEKLEEENLIEYEGSRVECSTHEIYSDGTIYLAECKVNDKSVEYTYGKEQEGKYKQVYKPHYYWFKLESLGSSTALPAGVTTTAPEGTKVYLGFDSEDGTSISKLYVCFIRNGNEYCLSRTEVFSKNREIVEDAYSDNPGLCSETLGHFRCRDDGINVGVSNGALPLVSVFDYGDTGNVCDSGTGSGEMGRCYKFTL